MAADVTISGGGEHKREISPPSLSMALEKHLLFFLSSQRVFCWPSSRPKSVVSSCLLSADFGVSGQFCAYQALSRETDSRDRVQDREGAVLQHTHWEWNSTRYWRL